MPYSMSLKRYLARELHHDAAYSRSISQTRVAKLVKKWDTDGVGVVTVNERKNGKLILLDGNHRVTAMKQMGLADHTVECIVYKGLPPNVEARLFALFNTQTTVSPADLFKADVMAGNEQAMEVAKIIANHNYVVGHNNPRSIRRPQAFYKLYEEGRLNDVLRFCNKTWPEGPSEVGREMPQGLILGLAEFLKRYPELDLNDFSRRLAQQSSTRWMNEIRARGKAAGLRQKQAAAEVFFAAYNFHRQKGRLYEGKRRGRSKKTTATPE